MTKDTKECEHKKNASLRHRQAQLPSDEDIYAEPTE